MVQNLTLWDFIVAPVFILILSVIARKQRDKRYPVGHVLRQYYMKGLYVKFAGAILIGLIYEYYYGGGDTFNYFHHTQTINSAFGESVTTWLKLLFKADPISNPDVYPYAIRMEWYTDPASYTVGAIAAAFGILCGTLYLPIAILFAYFSFTGIWAMYRTFVNIYPKLHKELAVAFLFIPSTFVWGSAVFKDTICMFGLGWLIYTTFRVFVNKDFTIKNLALLALSFYLIYKVKIYILMAFLPALSIWILTIYSVKIKNAPVRLLMRIGFVALTIAGFFFFSQLFANELKRYSLEKIAFTASETRQWLSYSSGDEGSSYDLGEFDPSITGMLKKFPQAVVVTLFRPFPWEAKKVIVLLSALEALTIVYFTIQAFRRRGVFPTFKIIAKDPNILFCLIFALIFAFAVGISSYNFGALSRYKIPCLPFYGAFLVILMYDGKKGVTQVNTQLKSAKKLPAWA